MDAARSGKGQVVRASVVNLHLVAIPVELSSQLAAATPILLPHSIISEHKKVEHKRPRSCKDEQRFISVLSSRGSGSTFDRWP